MVTECRRQRLKVKTLLLQCCALRKFHMTDGHNTRDQITIDRRSKASDQIALRAFHSFLVSKQILATYM